MPDFNPMLLLAGPVLRRVTPTSVSVWVATSQPCDVRLDVYGSIASLHRPADSQTGTVSATSLGNHTRSTVRVGDALHIAVVTAAVNGVAPDTICSYNVTLDVTEPAPSGLSWTGQWDLGGLKLLDAGDLSDDYSGGLGYVEGQLPTFATPPQEVRNLRLFHGSCYKMHGYGPSMLPNLDDLLSDALPADGTAQKQRPHMLLLTGDQIYADDVATPLSAHLTALGQQLLGSSQESVAIDGTRHVAVTQQELPAGRRQKLIRMTAGMTSDDADNHLIGFGEWAALYLLCWTGRLKDRLITPHTSLWPDTLSLLYNDDLHDPHAADAIKVLDPAATPSSIDDLLTPIYTDSGRSKLQSLRSQFKGEREQVAKTGDDGDKVRRALANIPVLTICDDHEVTDDWFITGAWRARVLAAPLGRAMIRNALIAYVMFQAWGNTPDAFEDANKPEGRLLALIPQLFSGAGTLPDAAVCAQIDTLFGLDDPTGNNNPAGGVGATRVSFHYKLDVAGVRLVVLDTRTRREYGTPNGPPGLLTQSALDEQLPIADTDNVSTLVVVSPAPVLGPKLMEDIAQPLSIRGYDLWHALPGNDSEQAANGYVPRRPEGDLYFDAESWSGRSVAFERFLDRVSRCPQVVILAGDVHYGASFTMDYQRFTVPADQGGVPPTDPVPASSTSRIVHFTSSALHNSWMPKVEMFTRSIAIAENLEKAGFDGAALGWHRMLPPVLSDAAASEARPVRARLRREPVIVSTVGWKGQHSIRPPEWMYRILPLVDTRTDDVRFQDLLVVGYTDVLSATTPDIALAPPDSGPAVDWTIGDGPYSIATRLHAASVEGGAATRTLVFANNIGVVTFAQKHPTDPLSVQMALYFIRYHPAGPDEKPHAYVVHAASLAPVPLIAPTTVGV